MNDFKNELTALINKHSIENVCDVPDFILSDMVCRFINAIGQPIKQTLDWHGTDSICHPKGLDIEVDNIDEMQALTNSEYEISAQIPPQDICIHAIKLSNWFKERNIKEWAVGDVKSRCNDAKYETLKQERDRYRKALTCLENLHYTDEQTLTIINEALKK